MTQTTANLPAPLAAANPAATGVGVDTSFGWTVKQVNHVMLQNNTTASVNWELDAAATPGSATLAAGATVFLDVTCSVAHLYTAAAQKVNGAVAGNIVLRGWL